MRILHSLGFRVGLVSGGFTFFVDDLKSRFGLDFAFSNELEVADGKLTGRVRGSIVDASCGRVVVTQGRSRRRIVQALADALQELADSSELRHGLGEAARRRAARYGWRDQVANVYGEIGRALAAEAAPAVRVIAPRRPLW